MLKIKKNKTPSELEDEIAPKREQSTDDDCSWRYWGTDEFIDNLTDVYPDAPPDILKALVETTQKIYKLEKEREDKETNE